MQTDRPIQTAAQDRFDRAPFARRIAEVIRNRNDPATLVIGLYGPWGDGKSSTLGLIKEGIGTSDSVVQVDYNPWFFSSSAENLTRSFFLTLGDTLEKTRLFSRDKIGGLLRKYGGMVPKLGGFLKAAGEALSVTDLKAIRVQVEEILTRHKTPIVVFVDDIDRLDRKEIQSLFKLIRLSADFPHVIYVLAFDDEIVAAALGEAYEGGDADAGRRFLEKIVQAPLHLPRASPEALRIMAFEAVDAILKANAIDLTEADTYAFANNFVLSLLPLMTTPRQAKLYENALTFAVPILIGEVNIVDLLLLEAIRTFVPSLYLTIRDNQDQFLKGRRDQHGDEDQLDNLIKAAFEKGGLTEALRKGIRNHVMEKLFPRISTMGYGNEWDRIWAKDKHLCVSDYFPRYFRYGVPTGDIPDRLVDQVLGAASVNDAVALGNHFSKVARQSAFPAFIRKLRTCETEISKDAAMPLVSVIAQSANILPREPSSMFTDWTITQAAILTTHLAQKFEEEEARFAAIRLAVTESTSSVYSVELLRWSRRYEEKGETSGFLEEVQISTLANLIAAKIVSDAKGAALYRFLGDDTNKLLLRWSWYGDQAMLRANIEASVASEGADGAEALIQVCSGKSWEMQTGIPHVSDVRMNVYKTIALFADPELIMSKLRERYGAKLDEPTFHVDRDTSLGERLAIQFAYVHQKALTGEKEGGSD